MEILVPLGFFAMIAAIVVLPAYFRSKERQKIADTVRAAIEKGQPLPPEMIEALTSDARQRASSPAPEKDLRNGMVCLGVAVGLALFGVAVGFVHDEARYALMGVAAFPGFIGVAFVALGLMGRAKART